MWDRVRSIDWSKTSLGAGDGWSYSLKSTLRMVLETRQPVCFWWGRDLLQFYNEAYAPILGDREDRAFGAPFRELWSDIIDDLDPYMQKALSGHGTWEEDMPLIMYPFGEPVQTYWSFSYSPLYDDDGDIAGVINITTDNTTAVTIKRTWADENEKLTDALDDAQDTIVHQRERERTRRVVQTELSHRLKNSFAMVNAIVGQSLRGATSISDAGNAITSRLHAMSNAQDVLINALEGGALIGTVVETALKPHENGARQITIEGPDVTIPAQQGMGMALAVHELATNAVKYGALSVPDGKVDVSWSLDGNQFKFSWMESGGPEPTPSTRKGFGSRILDRIVPGYFSGGASSRFDPTGLAYTLVGTIDVGDDKL